MNERKAMVSRQRVSQIRRVARGLCVKCPEQRINATHCERHRAEHNAKRLEKMRQRRRNGQCALCGRPSTTYECERHRVERPS